MKRFFAYWIPTVLLLIPMVGSGVWYFIDTPAVAAVFVQLGYPVYTMYFNAIAKMLGGIAIVTPVPRFLTEFAYAGYLYIMLLALQALWMSTGVFPWIMLVFIALWLWAYIAYRLYGRSTKA